MARSESPSTSNLNNSTKLTYLSAGDKALPNPDQSRSVLCNHLDYMEKALSSEKSEADIQQIKEKLLHLAEVIRSQKKALLSDHYRRILQRLIAIYARGLAKGDKEAFITTAADYADVIEAISQAYPGYDYSEAVGQLLYYMCQQFRIRKQSWMTIYRHIAAMSGEIGLKKKKGFLELRRWAEEGVDQLFQIRQNLQNTVEQLEKAIRQIDENIQTSGDATCLNPTGGVASASGVSQYNTGNSLKNNKLLKNKVTDIAVARKRKANRALIMERDSLIEKKQGKTELIELIEENIQEFETVMRNARRAYLLRLV